MRTLSTGMDSTLGNYRKMAVMFMGANSKAVKFLDKKIADSPNGENEEVIADERQMVTMLFEIERQEDNPPFIAFGNDEIRKMDELGDLIKCKHCGEMHKVETSIGKNSAGEISKNATLSFTVCADGKVRLVGIMGKKIDYK